jgi:hypothetical protein
MSEENSTPASPGKKPSFVAYSVRERNGSERVSGTHPGAK